jgi:predicted ATP-grasp superfamily ATP-dependent carboligase
MRYFKQILREKGFPYTMARPDPLLILGASARAAAFSALRAGLRPWCADLFADTDLKACCVAFRLEPVDYPQGFVRVARQGPPGPWLYTGGLENRPALVRRLARERPLWGNDAPVLRVVRSPRAVSDLLRGAGLPCPEVRLPADGAPRGGRWLVKPLRGAGGTAIRFWDGGTSPPPGGRVYLQEFIAGDSCAAVYVGDGSGARLLGVTRQLTGEPWLCARPFAYCGSIGPLVLAPAVRQALERLGDVLVRGTGLRGLFGVDFIRNDAGCWPVEVNPRYTASVEVLEHALGIAALESHRRVFESAPGAEAEPAAARAETGAPDFIGKAVLFARAPLVFPEGGAWQPGGEGPWRLPELADVPPPGTRIGAGRPVLTFFTRGASLANCRERLQRIAADLDRRLGG